MKNIIFALLMAAGATSTIACPDHEEVEVESNQKGPDHEEAAVESSKKGNEIKGEKTMTDKLQIIDTTAGTGDEAKKGDTVEVHYVGTLLNGTKFDSSRDRGQTFSFTIGQGGVIKGWDEGIPGMKIGGKRELTIPADMAYGTRAIGSIPANSTLKFEVELISINK